MTSASYDLHGVRTLACSPDGKKLRSDRFDDDFFRLRTRVAGRDRPEVRDFVYEANRGNHVWFVTNPQALGQRLTQ
ncbi:MAG TPA: hypothetical protein VMQ86_24485 [Bryobacteraceae bacterium]|jgi:hypothetical protein|nr:hypothetical protein [Bryobacteraceae bacterium]